MPCGLIYENVLVALHHPKPGNGRACERHRWCARRTGRGSALTGLRCARMSTVPIPCGYECPRTLRRSLVIRVIQVQQIRLERHLPGLVEVGRRTSDHIMDPTPQGFLYASRRICTRAQPQQSDPAHDASRPAEDQASRSGGSGGGCFWSPRSGRHLTVGHLFR